MSAGVDPTKLVGRWTHSHEEDQGDRVVYRAAGHRFPPSRGRRSFTLELDGSARLGQPGPVDRGQSIAGQWKLQGDVLHIEAGDTVETYAIESFDGSTLVLRKR